MQWKLYLQHTAFFSNSELRSYNVFVSFVWFPGITAPHSIRFCFLWGRILNFSYYLYELKLKSVSTFLYFVSTSKPSTFHCIFSTTPIFWIILVKKVYKISTNFCMFHLLSGHVTAYNKIH